MSIKKQLDKSPKGLFDYKLVLIQKNFNKTLIELNKLRKLDKDVSALEKENDDLTKRMLEMKSIIINLKTTNNILKQDLVTANIALEKSIDFDSKLLDDEFGSF